MSTLKERITGFSPAPYVRVKRGDQSYADTVELVANELELLIDRYNSSQRDGQYLRLLRDGMDFWLRRYHNYAINGSIGAHYRQVGLTGSTVFEHVVPAARVRDMMIAGVLTIQQAMNMPTCLISKTNDQDLREHGLVSTNHDCWHFFQRYSVITNSTFETHKGQVVDLNTWTLADHFDYFGISI